MRILSFAYTTPALLAGVKRVTRRDWDPDFAQRFRSGELVKAYDRHPRYRGAHVADIRLTRRPYLELIAQMPDCDYVLEGFKYLYEHPEVRPKTIFGEKVTPETFSWDWFCEWRQSGGSFWVVRFEIARVVHARPLQGVEPKPLGPATLEPVSLFTYAGLRV